jgi:hypothetical protein
LSPLTYLADFFWASVSGTSVFHPLLNLTVIGAWALLMSTLSLLVHGRTIERRL